MRRQLVALAAALLLIAALVPTAAARSAPWTHYTWPNAFTQSFADLPGGSFCGAVKAEASGVTEEYDGPRVGNTVQYTLTKKWLNVFTGPNGKTVTARVESVGLYTDTYNPAWPSYEGPWLWGWPQFQTVSEAGLLWSLVASDGARLDDSGVAITRWELGAPTPPYAGSVVSEKAVSLIGRHPIYRGGFSPDIQTWTVGCQFFMDHLLP